MNRRENWDTELIHGTVAPGWEPVKEEFVQNFRCRGELGASVCIYITKDKVSGFLGRLQGPREGAPMHGNKIRWCPCSLPPREFRSLPF